MKSDYGLNFNLNKKNDVYQHSWKEHTNFANFTRVKFRYFITFRNKLFHFTNFKMLFLAVLIAFVHVSGVTIYC